MTKHRQNGENVGLPEKQRETKDRSQGTALMPHFDSWCAHRIRIPKWGELALVSITVG